MRGHEEASGTKYVPQELMDEWQQKDPVVNYENYLVEEKVLDDAKIEIIKAEIKAEINSEWEKAFNEPKIIANMQTELNDVYAPFAFSETKPTSEKKSEKRLIDAISD
jgi:2-oxoisovalerate dehydrogenase E1 component